MAGLKVWRKVCRVRIFELPSKIDQKPSGVPIKRAQTSQGTAYVTGLVREHCWGGGGS